MAESLNSTLQGLTTNVEIEQAATIYGHILELLIPGEENPEAQRATVQFPRFGADRDGIAAGGDHVTDKGGNSAYGYCCYEWNAGSIKNYASYTEK